MNAKIVYVLTSSKKDYYLEQALMSVYTLRHYNPNVTVVLVSDKDTVNYIKLVLPSFLDYFTEVQVVDVPDEFNNNIYKSRYLKTNLRHLITGDFLYVDTDTIITRDLSDIDNFDGELLAVPDQHLPIKDTLRKKRVLNDSLKYGFSYNEDSYFVNGGLMFARDTPLAHKFYSLWFENWKKTISLGSPIDQPALAISNEMLNYPIRFLPGEWNCQIVYNGLKYLDNAYIIHYFATNIKNRNAVCPYKLLDNKIYQAIRSNNGLTSDIINLCLNAKTSFRDGCLIITGKDIDLLTTNVYKFYLYHPKLFKMLDKFLSII